MPRSKKPPEKRRTVNLPSARCTADDKAEIERRANALNLSVSEYIVQAATGKKIKTSQTAKADPALIFSLKAIGNNLNQIARRFHMTGEKPPADLDHILHYIRTYVLKQITE